MLIFLCFFFQIDITTLSIVPLSNGFEIIDGNRPITARSSTASFNIEQDIGGQGFFKMPYSLGGNNVKSYGGYLSYTINVQGQPNIDAPTVILIVTTLLISFEV